MGWSLRPSSSGTAPRFHLCLRVQRDRAGSAERVTDGRLLPPHPKGKSTKKEKHPPQQGRRSAQGVPPALCQLRAGGFPPCRLQSPRDGGILRWSTNFSSSYSSPAPPKGLTPTCKTSGPHLTGTRMMVTEPAGSSWGTRGQTTATPSPCPATALRLAPPFPPRPKESPIPSF